ncbi:tetrahydrocannabinolic acid synthase-like [Gossypium hirsutum]|uniref:Tetrahydrocannabinolic acid synthase-like n=1 Tax=Gossypium hirsutum TaxID=3635 RepID=A0A1U8IE03_GOSHI|nr:tetrahydrocannabinolic acid synthase-like [Gossypium hirsutum]
MELEDSSAFSLEVKDELQQSIKKVKPTNSTPSCTPRKSVSYKDTLVGIVEEDEKGLTQDFKQGVDEDGNISISLSLEEKRHIFPFVVIDLVNFLSVDVDVENRVAWIQAGVILGEVYYRIAEKSRTLTFVGGVFHSIGVGGYIRGRGFGLLFRKYGTGSDNVIDAQFINVNGRILDRKSIGEDLFWAIRCGGGNFGIILTWKLKLVTVSTTESQ